MSGGVGAAPARGLVTVDGVDGSGKSTFARRLHEALGSRSALLRVDDFRRPVAWPADDATAEATLYYERRYDLAALEDCVRAFLAGAEACSFPRYDSATETLGAPQEVPFSGASWLIVEGVFVARLPSAEQAMSIYVDITLEEAWRRVRLRDTGGTVARSPEEVERRIQRRYLPAHRRYADERSPRERADLLIDNADPSRPEVRRVRWPGSGSAAPVTSGVTALRSALGSLLPLSP